MERFFILGCQRTGTTLLRLILESHPEVFCYDELKGYAVLEKAIIDNPTPNRRFIGFKLPRWTEQFTSPILCDEGAEGSCPNFYRGEKILFMQRDVRDTISSMLKLRTGDTTWCESWVPRIIRAKISGSREFSTRYASELALIESSDSPLIGFAALYWKYKNDALADYQRAGFPVLPVPYEKLVTKPKPVLQAICEHLNLPFHQNLLRHNTQPHSELFGNGLTVGNTDPKAPIQPTSVRQYDRYLAEKELRLIEQIAGRTGHRCLWPVPDAPRASRAYVP